MNELSLFSGAGGGILGTKYLLGFRTIGYAEWDPYCQEVLKARIADGFLDPAPIFGDIRKFISEGYAELYRGRVDVLTAGFPCQPFSVAGKQQGEDDPRNMWPATIECIRIIRPRYCFLENVPGLLADRYIGRIFGDLAEAGYDARWIVLGADDCGAPHRRKRLWILADNYNGHGFRPEEQICTRGHSFISGREDVADTSINRSTAGFADSPRGEEGNTAITLDNRSTWWLTDPADVPDTEEAIKGRADREDNLRGRHPEVGRQDQRDDRAEYRPTQPRLGRVAHGVAHRVDRLKALGNGQVPICAAMAFRILSGEMK